MQVTVGRTPNQHIIFPERPDDRLYRSRHHTPFDNATFRWQDATDIKLQCSRVTFQKTGAEIRSVRQSFDAVSQTVARDGSRAFIKAVARDIFGEFAFPLSSEAR